MLVLADDRALVRIDPAHGAEILDLVDLRTSRQLLGRSPWSAAPARGGELSEAEWTAGYRGGWQTLLPNAGNACVVDGVSHGFHGRASADPWSLAAASPTAATLVWEGHGLRAERTFALTDGALRVETTLACTGTAPVPYVMVEHVALGIELLDPETELLLPPADAHELDAEGGPIEPPADAPRWPELRALDGTRVRADRLRLDETRSRLLVLHGLPHGRAAVRNPAHGQGLALAWDEGRLPHLWVWDEARASEGPWRNAGELLVIEPATVPHHLGLDAAVRHGQADRLAPGERARSWIVARPFSSARPVREVAADGRLRHG